jgi:hypothetical protein
MKSIKPWIYFAGGLSLCLIAGYSLLYFVFSSPTYAYPKTDHYHFRFQLVQGGKAFDFSQAEFQKEQPAGACKGGLLDEPFHFHDVEDQLVHVHWMDVTGKQFMEYYGYNQPPAEKNTIVGYRLDTLWKFPPSITSVVSESNALSSISTNSTKWIYTGDETGFTNRKWADFYNQDINVFFGKKSQYRIDQESKKTSWLETTVLAHGGVIDNDEVTSQAGTGPTKSFSKQELETINDLVGNIVIFVQDKEPSPEEITAKFKNLIPLKDSVCGG